MTKIALFSVMILGCYKLSALQGDIQQKNYAAFAKQYSQIFDELPSGKVWTQCAAADCASHGGNGTGCDGDGGCRGGGTEA